MAFAIRNLSVLNYAQGFTSWHYRGHATTLGATLTGPTTMAEVQTAGFFAPAKDMLAVGDLIIVSTSDGMVQLCVATAETSVTVRRLCATEPQS
jgi:hypothetical protein